MYPLKPIIFKLISGLEKTLKIIEGGLENVVQINQGIKLINGSITNIDEKIDTIVKKDLIVKLLRER
ncbi:MULTISPECIES: hypothetical protein [Bacillus]|uniref:hypothetical protein n=1 Tax=Bacillus TaxID=1386 RepID=UPI000BEBEE8E|nr:MULTISPECIES: hypothetical protein [Bacillus]PEE33469.1 hypothetical protein CON59_25470 [Bacillus cereus]PET44186.1 hypothetical protein CN523_20345 [Bacillus cereus]PEV74656.1 hypothetical protein CN429_23415 [Bacillus cereus]PEW23228.1 hypothetical protein CN439_00990 [Bacillus cereus]PFA43721.1 hypothetical protein CN389_28010 [Bacillus cereus]